jgi:hypothetical protein
MYNNAQSIKPMTISIINTIPPPAAPMAIAIVKPCVGIEEFPEGVVGFVEEGGGAVDDGDENLVLVRVVAIDKDDTLLIADTRLLDITSAVVTVVEDDAGDVLMVFPEVVTFAEDDAIVSGGDALTSVDELVTFTEDAIVVGGDALTSVDEFIEVEEKLGVIGS